MTAEHRAGSGRRAVARRASRAVVAILAAAVLLAVHVAPLPSKTMIAQAVANALHAPAFAVLAVGLFELLGHVTPRGRILLRYGGALVAAALVGGVAELAQDLGPRSSSLADWLRDVVGAAAGLGLRATFDRRVLAGPGSTGDAARLVVASAAVAVLLTGLAPVAWWTHAYIRRDAAFPVLGAFEESWELGFWKAREADLDLVAAPEEWAGHDGSRVARLRLRRGRFPGVSLVEPSADWRRYEALDLDVFSPGPTPVTLTLRVHDATHDGRHADRYTLERRIEPGAHVVRVALDDVRRGPRDRELDLSRVDGLIIYASRPEVPFTLYLDNVRLVRSVDPAVEGARRGQRRPAPPSSAKRRKVSGVSRNTVQSSSGTAPSRR